MINIKETFLKLTQRRYPMGSEDLAMELVKEMLPDVKFEKDEFDNYYLYIPKEDGTDSDTMFTSHLDTIDSGLYGYSSRKWNSIKGVYENDPNDKTKIDDKSVKHVFDGDFVKTDGESNLGADDKAGVAILMNMISENIPGLYYLFMGEESGCVGSSSLSRVLESKDFPKMKKCISFDRRGYDSIITEQTSVCASNEFANELADRFNEYGFWFKPDPTGVYTDSAEFTDLIPECTNISVGYFSEHTKSEKQDLEFLELLGIVCTQINWETLPIVRDVDKVYKGKKSQFGNRYNSWDWDDDYNNVHSHYRYGSYNKKKKRFSQYDLPKTNTSKFFKDDGDSSLTEFNNDTITETNKKLDFDFDKWYNEQKSKSRV